MLDFRSRDDIEVVAEKRRLSRENIPVNANKSNCIGIFWMIEHLPERFSKRLDALSSFFTMARLECILIPIVAMRSRVSLRTLDWFVINYAKQYKVTLVSENGFALSVYNDYRSRLRYWQRDLFDPFRRGPRIFFDANNRTYSTTVAQLNFFFWCESTGVLQYLSAHLDEVERDMSAAMHRCKQIKQGWRAQGIKRKRCELAHPSLAKCQIVDVPVTFSFNHPVTMRC